MASDTKENRERFVALACVNYDGGKTSPGDRIAEAHRMLEDDPGIATGSIEALTTVGDHQAVARLLHEQPDVATDGQTLYNNGIGLVTRAALRLG